MATMTEEQRKQKARENLAKAREAKKAKAAAEAAKAEEQQPVSEPSLPADSAQVSDHDIERDARRVEKNTFARFKGEELVPYTIPYAYGVEERAQVYTRSYNGVVVALKRGQPLMLPRGIVNQIERQIRIEKEGAKRVAEFASAKGKCFG